MRFRRLHKMYAQAIGFFWLPCPLCGQCFGGHEWRSVNGHHMSIPDPNYPAGTGRGTGICPDCTAKAKGCEAWQEHCKDPDHEPTFNGF